MYNIFIPVPLVAGLRDKSRGVGDDHITYARRITAAGDGETISELGENIDLHLSSETIYLPGLYTYTIEISYIHHYNIFMYIIYNI